MTSHARRPAGIALLAAGALLLTAACGSTVQPSGDALGGGGQAGAVQQGLAPAGPGGGAPGQPGVSTDGLVTSGGGTTGSVTGPGTTGGTTSGGTTGAGTTTGSTGSSGTGGSSAAVAMGPGVTATEIRLGIPYCNDCAAGNAAAGAAGEDPGDTRRYYQAVLDDVNASGGVLGRKLVPVFHEVSVSDNIEASQQAACETFTSDNKVLIMFFRGEIVYECAKKAGIIAWGSGGSGPLFEKYPNMFAPSTIRLERLAAVTVNAMVKAGWHKPDAKWPTGKVGLITWETSDYEYAVEKGWLPAMKKAGITPTDVRYIAVPQNANALADASAAISSAVLSFRQKGIDHVFIGDGAAGIFTGTGLTLLFLQNAKSQSYYPRYGFNSNNSPDFDSHPQDQLVGMLAIDSFDTEPANDEGIALNPQRERCFAIMKKKGLPVGQGQTQAVAVGACEIAWFAEAVVERARDTTLAGMIASGESLGTSYRSPYNYGNRIGPGQHDGVALFRDLRYDESCSCLKYTSKPYEP